MVTKNAIEEHFDINTFLSDRTTRTLKQSIESKTTQSKVTLNQVVEQLSEFFHEKFENQSISDRDRDERQQVEHKAMLGDKESMFMLVDEIQGFIRDNNIHSVNYPAMYESLAHAIFEQIFRFKEFYKWSLYPDSPSAKIVGKELWFKIKGVFVKQEEELESEESVYEIIRLLQQGNRSFRINQKNPQGELDLADGTRVTLTIPPRTLVPTIVFRKFIVNQFSFKEQVRRKTIHPNDQRLFEILAKARLNTIIAGHVESGKSTMLKTFYSQRPKDKVALLIEEHPESFLKRDFPDRLVHEFSIKDNDVQRVLRTILRFDHDYVIFQEVRGIEADAAMDGASRGSTGLLMTYHVTEPSKVVEQLAQHIIDEFPNRRNVNEVRRVAQTLHLGVTMQNTENNEKKVTSVYEICYDFDTDTAWIQYILKYDDEAEKWLYNPNISSDLYKRLNKSDDKNLKVADEFIAILEDRASHEPIPEEDIKQMIYFKGGD
ncbi:MAG: CpaF/VirB11 family protein [Carnobacterium alterfunditum]